MRVLELGGGFGGLSYYLCTHFGVSVHACDLSVEHEVYSKEHFAHENKTFEIIDYRDFLKRHIREGTPLFDRVVSVGMMEHVGPRNFPNFFRQIRKVIKPQGLFLLHTIGNSVDDRNQDPWFEKYVFPGACIPGPQTFFQPGHRRRLEARDWHNFGSTTRTRPGWWDNSIAARGELPAEKYDERLGAWGTPARECRGLRGAVDPPLAFVLSPRACSTTSRAAAATSARTSILSSIDFVRAERLHPT